MNRRQTLSEILQERKTVKLKNKKYKKSIKVTGKDRKKDVYVIKGDSYRSTILELTKPIRVKNCTLILMNVRLMGTNIELINSENSYVVLEENVRLEAKYTNGSYTMMRLKNSRMFNYSKIIANVYENVTSLVIQDCVRSDVYNMYARYAINAIKDLPVLKVIKNDFKVAMGYCGIILATNDDSKFGKVTIMELENNAVAEITFLSLIHGILYGNLKGDELRVSNRKEGLVLGSVDNLVAKYFNVVE